MLENVPEDDPVDRLARFRDRHPEVAITAPSAINGPYWTAVEDGDEVASGYWLRHLMDKLEAKYG